MNLTFSKDPFPVFAKAASPGWGVEGEGQGKCQQSGPKGAADGKVRNEMRGSFGKVRSPMRRATEDDAANALDERISLSMVSVGHNERLDDQPSHTVSDEELGTRPYLRGAGCDRHCEKLICHVACPFLNDHSRITESGNSGSVSKAPHPALGEGFSQSFWPEMINRIARTVIIPRAVRTSTEFVDEDDISGGARSSRDQL